MNPRLDANVWLLGYLDSEKLPVEIPQLFPKRRSTAALQDASRCLKQSAIGYAFFAPSPLGALALDSGHRVMA